MSTVDPLRTRSTAPSFNQQMAMPGDRTQIGGQPFEYRQHQVRSGDDLGKLVSEATGTHPPEKLHAQLCQMTALANGLKPGEPLPQGFTIMLPRSVGAAAPAGGRGGSPAAGLPATDTYAGPARQQQGRVDVAAGGASREDWDRGTARAGQARPVDATKVDNVRKDVAGLVEAFQRSNETGDSWAAMNRLAGVTQGLASLTPGEFKHLASQLDEKQLGQLLHCAQKHAEHAPGMLRAIEQLAVQTDQPTVEKLHRAAYEVASTELAGDAKKAESDALKDVGRTFASMKEMVPEHLPIRPDKTHVPQPGEHQSIKTQPSQVQVGKQWASTPLKEAMDGNKLDLGKVTPGMLKELDPTQRQALMKELGRHKVNVEAKDPGGNLTTGGYVFGCTTEMSAAAALGAKMWASGDSAAFTQAFAAAPDQMLPLVSGSASRVMTPENVALIMQEMSKSGNEFSSEEMRGLGNLVHQYLEHAGNKDPGQIARSLEQLVGAVNQTMDFTPQNAGVLAGAIAGGMAKYFDSIKASDEQRVRLVNGVADVIGAAAGFSDKFGSPVGVAIETMKVIYNEVDQPRDFKGYAEVFQGAFITEWMNRCPKEWSRDDRSDAIHWMEGAWKSNQI